ncbi:MAG: DNA polymerase IV [Methanoregula sp.]|nr:DNA polymerase IV [Methanoregula sp.]
MSPVTFTSPALPVYPDDLPRLNRGVQEVNRRIILHIDMDSFYASVEMQRRPELSSKPVVIGADPKQGKGRGVVSTCSYEARAFGIRSAMPISQAFVLCPHAVFLPPDFPAYVQASAVVMEILRSYGFPTEQVSIDEAFLDLSSLGHFASAQSLADEIKAVIRARLGLSSSIGIAPGRAVAKIASDFRKPDGLTVVTPPALQDFLAPLPVRTIPGVGKKAEAMLFEMGIRTIGDLARQDIQGLIGRFGRSAVALHQLAHGIDESGIVDGQETKSISRETTFDTDTDDVDLIVSTLDSLIRSVCGNLAEEQLRFRTLTIKIRYPGFITRNRSRSMSHYSGDAEPVRLLAHSLFREEYDGRKVRLIGIRLSSFEKKDTCQATLPL